MKAFRFLGLVVLAAAVVGCAGPKRLPPVGGGPAAVLPELLEIGLLENQTSLELTAAGEARLIDRDTGEVLARVAPAGARVECVADGEVVVWRLGPNTGRVRGLILRPASAGGRVQQGSLSYRGEFLVVGSPVGQGLTLVNAVDLESYLKGVVPWEIGRYPEDKLAAMQAQAVAARTYTISHLNARRRRGFDLFASVMDQVYKGAKDEDKVCNLAIETTVGEVLRHQGREIEAYYSGCCGGVSSELHEVWARTELPYLASAPDVPAPGSTDFCAGSKYSHWRTTWTVSELEAILAETLPAYLGWVAASPPRGVWAGRLFEPATPQSDSAVPGRLKNLQILDTTTSGRVAELAVTTEAGVYYVRGDRTRWVLRPADGHPFILRSALFALELERDGAELTGVAVRGRGYGHGIGLCQSGALGRAAAGQNYREILAHYYPQTTLATVSRP